jgi:hypothetical protein
MFRKKADREPVYREAITEQVSFPDNVPVETEDGFFYMKKNLRLRIPNERVLASWRFTNIPLYTEQALAKYPVLKNLPYRDGSLLKNQVDGRTYYVSGQKLRLIAEPKWFDRLGLNDNDVIIVSQSDIDYHIMGDDLV